VKLFGLFVGLRLQAFGLAFIVGVFALKAIQFFSILIKNS